jgi:insulysin
MIEFFNHYIHPSSPSRSKLAIHLNAQSLPPTSSASAALENGIEALGLNSDKKDEGNVEVLHGETVGNGTTPYVITDVRKFKSMLQVSAGPQPVKHISEFEEFDSKL